MRTLSRALVLFALLACAPLAEAARPGQFAIGPAGTPTISGGMNASVAGASQVGGRLQLTIDFGEVSPLNAARMVVVSVPVALRSLASYEVLATVSGTVSGDPNAVQLSDVGFGMQNLRRLGKFATNCGANSKIQLPFNNDPSTNVDLSKRAAYTSTLADIGLSRAVLRGPKLSTKVINNKKKNGYIVDVVLVIIPQFYSVGTFRATLTLTMGSGPSLPCSR